MKTHVMLASLALYSNVLAIAAQAQTYGVPNTADGALHGTGDGSIGPVIVQGLNCVGGHNPYPGFTVPEPNLTSPPYSTGFNCDETVLGSQEIQPNFSAKYFETSSSFGRQAWRLKSNQFYDPILGTGSVHNPFVDLFGEPAWDHLQFAFADTGATPADIQAYKSAAGAASLGGNPIQFPMYVLPVAVVYAPQYGTNASNVAMNFAVQTPASINGVTAGGLRMTRELYCKVFNGEVTNFNDPLFTAANGGVTLQDKTNDTTARWTSAGVPIRLVGRMDKSGTTDIFTRALAEQCDAFVSVNKFATNAESLPWGAEGGVQPDFTSQRSDTSYHSTPGPVAGTVNSVSTDYWTSSNTIGSVASFSGGAISSLPAIATPTIGSGRFLLVDGNIRMRNAINAAPDYILSSVKLNGKIGYIGSNFVAGSATASPILFAAALQNPNASSTTYAMPSADQATSAFGTIILPPESTSTGAWATGDTRQVRDPASTTGATIAATRTNPLAWYDVLYGPFVTLANPVTGYPLTGTIQFLGHQCYQPNTRRQMAEFLLDSFDQYTMTSTGTGLPTGMFTGTFTGINPPGIPARSNIGIVPSAWRTAIIQTFLTNSSQTSGGVTLGRKNLWILSNSTRNTGLGAPTANTTVCGSGGAAIGA